MYWHCSNCFANFRSGGLFCWTTGLALLELFKWPYQLQSHPSAMQPTQLYQPKCTSRCHVIPHAFRARLRAETDAGETKTEKIYIGQGKYVEDNPEKYPDKTVLAGGWAGGEKGRMASPLSLDL